MRVLIISTYDLQGGAAIAAYRLMHALRKAGCDASMAVRTRLSDDPKVVQVGSEAMNRLHFYRERGSIFLHNRLSRENLFDVSIANSGVSITSLPEFKAADVIHLHWINQGMLSLTEIERILASGKKVVWTLHDMWAFTGICHHAAGCRHYEVTCGNCPYLAAPSPRDLSYRGFLKKQITYAKGKITFVACSDWLKELAEKSPLTHAHWVTSIPNPIDTTAYSPGNKEDAREKMRLPHDTKIVLFAAAKASDPRKGMEYLIRASEMIASERDDLLFLIAGRQSEEIAQRLPLPSQSLGYVAPDRMKEVYNAADLYVTPSLLENLPNTIMEAMACGTPCVGFNTGGIPEMIDHGENGYVAEYQDAADLARGIKKVLFEDNWKQLATAAREKVLSKYSEETIANSYKTMYEG